MEPSIESSYTVGVPRFRLNIFRLVELRKRVTADGGTYDHFIGTTTLVLQEYDSLFLFRAPGFLAG